MYMNKKTNKYTGLYEAELKRENISDPKVKADAFGRRLDEMYSSEIYSYHDRYPTMNTELIYAVIAMCLELKEYGYDDAKIISFVNGALRMRRKAAGILLGIINVLPFSWQIVKNWNINDHADRVKDGSITYDTFLVSEEKIEYSISRCMYVEMFRYYGIQSLCRIFCMTDETSYAGLAKHVKFLRHSDLSSGDSCHDEIFRRKKAEGR